MTPSLTEAVEAAIAEEVGISGTPPHVTGTAAAAGAVFEAIEAAGFEIVAKRQESATITLKVGQRWVPTSPKAKPRTIIRFGSCQWYPWAGHECVYFKVEGEPEPKAPKVLHPIAFRRWIKERAARPGAGEK